MSYIIAFPVLVSTKTAFLGDLGEINQQNQPVRVVDHSHRIPDRRIAHKARS